MKLKNMEQ